VEPALLALRSTGISPALFLLGSAAHAGAALLEKQNPSLKPKAAAPGIFLENVGGKGVRRLVEYFMGYYTMWLAPVMSFLVPFWELGRRKIAPPFTGR
jgi:hypothetical protein